MAVKVMVASHGEHAAELESFRQEVRPPQHAPIGHQDCSLKSTASLRMRCAACNGCQAGSGLP